MFPQIFIFSRTTVVCVDAPAAPSRREPRPSTSRHRTSWARCTPSVQLVLAGQPTSRNHRWIGRPESHVLRTLCHSACLPTNRESLHRSSTIYSALPRPTACSLLAHLRQHLLSGVPWFRSVLFVITARHLGNCESLL